MDVILALQCLRCCSESFCDLLNESLMHHSSMFSLFMDKGSHCIWRSLFYRFDDNQAWGVVNEI